jgi:hypothetical protein
MAQECVASFGHARRTARNVQCPRTIGYFFPTRLVAKRLGHAYQFVFSRNAGHVDDATEAQTMAEALEWLWKDYPAPVR